MNEVNPGPQQQPSVPQEAAPAWPPRPFIPPPPPMVLEPIPAWKWAAAIILVVAFAGGSVVFVKWSRAQSHKAEAAVTALHQKMMGADDAGIFANSDATYRETITAETSNGMFDNVRTRLGAPRSSTQTDSDDSTDETMGSFLTLHYSTVFDKGSGDETICLHNVDGVWKLAAYNVESPLLRTNKPAILLKVKPSSEYSPQRTPIANQ
jgi:hypothetical protein